MILKFQGTDGMGDMLDGILDRMGKVIHRVNAPGITGIVMSHMSHTVDNRVAHIHVRRCHIDLRTQYLLTILVLTSLHILE